MRIRSGMSLISLSARSYVCLSASVALFALRPIFCQLDLVICSTEEIPLRSNSVYSSLQRYPLLR
jgi:hypothetical protein